MRSTVTVDIQVNVHPVRSKHAPYPFFGKVSVAGMTVYETTIEASNLKEAQDAMMHVFAVRMSNALREN
jgi:hypothetical protein